MRKTMVIILAVVLALAVSCNNEPAEAPTVSVQSGTIEPYTSVTLGTSVNRALIRYTLDGTDPTYESKLYESPVVIIQNAVLKAAVFKSRRMVSTIAEVSYQIEGSAGGLVFYDCDADNDSTNDGAGPDNLKSSVCGWRYLEAAPEDLAVGTTTSFLFGYYRNSPKGANLFLNGSSYVEGTSDANDGKCTGTAMGTGNANTSKLVDKMGQNAYVSVFDGGCTADYAATACADYTYGTYSDWFLPSKDELNMMYRNLKTKGLGGFVSDRYWSSSEFGGDVTCAWYQAFDEGYQGALTRNVTYRVRPVRAF